MAYFSNDICLNLYIVLSLSDFLFHGKKPANPVRLRRTVQQKPNGIKNSTIIRKSKNVFVAKPYKNMAAPLLKMIPSTKPIQ